MTVVDVGAPDPVRGDGPGAPTPSWTVHGDLTEFAPAWVAALGELKEVTRSRTVDVGSYSYSYSELGDVLSLVRGVLASHDLALFQVAEVVDGDVAVSTTVMHTSGVYLVFAPFHLPAGNTAQNVGSSCTYARRYSLLSILGLGTEDDDGKNAGTRTPRPGTTLSQENVDRFIAAAHDNLLTAEEIGLVVFDATKGRTIDPANVYVSEVAALREALHRHSDEGVSQSDGAGEQASPAPAESGGGKAAPHTADPSPDQPTLEDTPDE